ncbi:class I SAM-dependent methyltransferase [Lyngbya confervoides]|uniref:SAM-dependent methyltransferase n=1 Tax=Lyngbya confervoides BDU141951 TaxID=1574623 RepID=A0ABD4T769_9CYAN|nr:SAM-dependent methyltransferase [Lyngbya confervoides]MCM1984100.1 SAM-dependent methyltransferase [Lyngbya confervoides BDU141951]
MSLPNPIHCAIRQSPQGYLSFADFMELALYHPEIGYYAQPRPPIGSRGDFVTATHLAPDFGELMVLQFYDFWKALDRPRSFTVVEMGAGQGLMSMDGLRFLAQTESDDLQVFAKALNWKIIERSPAMIAAQKSQLQGLPPNFIPLQWHTLTDLAPDSICGCFFSNELVDAFPVHRLRKSQGQLYEIGVGLGAPSSPAELQEKLVPLENPALLEYLSEMGIDLLDPVYPEGYTTEINLHLKPWIAQVAAALQQGFVLTIDYGYPVHRYYSPARSQGTLQCYTQQKAHGNPYERVGQQDITAHVNFTALEYYGTQAQLERLHYTQQGIMLMALGLGDRLHQNNSRPDLENLEFILQRRQALQGLIDPLGLGGFGVLLQAKGIPSSQRSYAYQGFPRTDISRSETMVQP